MTSEAGAQSLGYHVSYLKAGTRLVWVIDPDRSTAAVHRSLTDVRRLTESDALSGEDVLPGFSCPLRDVLGAD